MTIRDDRRDAAIERMADHVLSQGLGGATLRPLAAAAGVSDRMLLYYFADKDEILRAILDRIAARMIAELDAAIPAEPRRAFAGLLEQAWAALGCESLRPFMPLWLDLAAGAARGLQPHRAIAGDIADGFLSWATIRLLPEPEVAAPQLAAMFIAAIEGLYLLRAINRDGVSDTALTTFASRAARA